MAYDSGFLKQSGDSMEEQVRGGECTQREEPAGGEESKAPEDRGGIHSFA